MYTRLALLLTVLFAPLSLLAQDSTVRPPTTPFRRGQWAAQFAAGFDFSTVGFLLFRSPTRALLLDVRLGGGHSETLSGDSTGLQFAGLSSNAFTQLRFGWRRYSSGEPKIATHYTFGVLGGFEHSAGSASGSSLQRNGWTAGLFGDLGATYLVTPHLGLGALASASLYYSTSTAETRPTGGKNRTWNIGGSGVTGSIVATLFF
jgi:hypothetical protein